MSRTSTPENDALALLVVEGAGAVEDETEEIISSVVVGTGRYGNIKSEELVHLMDGDELLLKGALLGTVVVGIVRWSGEVPQRGLQKLPLKSAERVRLESPSDGKTFRLAALAGSCWLPHVGFGSVRSASDDGMEVIAAVVDWGISMDGRPWLGSM